MPKVRIVQALNKNERQAVMQWLSKFGPFWDENRQHGPGDWLEDLNGNLITDTGLGEAAYRRLFQETDCAVVSLSPSAWLWAPLVAFWHENDYSPAEKVEVPNFWDIDTLDTALNEASAPISTWKELEEAAQLHCPNLTFSSDCFAPLDGYPFGRGPAERLLSLLDVLQEIKAELDEHGVFKSHGRSLLQQNFAGGKSRFSDSSTSDKAKFRKELTFRHPDRPSSYLFCTWHGKVKTPQLRIHFSWPFRASEPLYIVYVGPKITVD